MIKYKSKEEIELMREAALVVSKTLGMLAKMIKPGVTPLELDAAAECAQDMLFAKQIMESIGLQVKLPMVLEVDNKGTVDLINNWSVGGRQCFRPRRSSLGLGKAPSGKGS